MPEAPPKRSRGRPPSNPNGADRTGGGGASKSRGRKPKPKVSEAEIEVTYSKPIISDYLKALQSEDSNKGEMHNNFLIG